MPKAGGRPLASGCAVTDTTYPSELSLTLPKVIVARKKMTVKPGWSQEGRWMRNVLHTCASVLRLRIPHAPLSTPFLKVIRLGFWFVGPVGSSYDGSGGNFVVVVATLWHMEFLGQGSDPSRSWNLYHSCGNVRSSNPLCLAGDQTCVLVLQRSRWSCCATVETPFFFLFGFSDGNSLPSFPSVFLIGVCVSTSWRFQ